MPRYGLESQQYNNEYNKRELFIEEFWKNLIPIVNDYLKEFPEMTLEDACKNSIDNLSWSCFDLTFLIHLVYKEFDRELLSWVGISEDFDEFMDVKAPVFLQKAWKKYRIVNFDVDESTDYKSVYEKYNLETEKRNLLVEEFWNNLVFELDYYLEENPEKGLYVSCQNIINHSSWTSFDSTFLIHLMYSQPPLGGIDWDIFRMDFEDFMKEEAPKILLKYYQKSQERINA